MNGIQEARAYMQIVFQSFCHYDKNLNLEDTGIWLCIEEFFARLNKEHGEGASAELQLHKGQAHPLGNTVTCSQTWPDGERVCVAFAQNDSPTFMQHPQGVKIIAELRPPHRSSINSW